MGYLDTFSFDSLAYIQRLANIPSDELIVKYREKMASIELYNSSSAWGLFAAIPTGGISLAWSGYATRQVWVAIRQRELITAEMGRRNMTLPTTDIPQDTVRSSSGGCGAPAYHKSSPPPYDKIDSSKTGEDEERRE